MTTTTVRRFAVVVLLSGLLAACDAVTSPDEYTDPSIPIRVSLDDQLVLRLESNPSTGFSWQIASPLDESIVRFEESRYVSDPSKLIGSGGSEYWTFRAVGTGRTTIAMRYVQSWESAEGTIREFQLEVE